MKAKKVIAGCRI